MSFSSLQKEEIIAQTPKSFCCRRAFLSGVLASRAKLFGDDIVLSLENRKNAEYVSGLIKEQYGKDAVISAPEMGGRKILLSFFSPSAHRKISEFTSFSAFREKKCAACEGAYLRGIFFACGKLSDPEKQYSLEFSTTDRSSELCEFFESIGLSAKISERSGVSSVYFRKSDEIEDFLASAAMNNTVFLLMNAKIEHDIRNNVNRVVNCETNNLERLEKASGKSVSLISQLMANDLLSSLPAELELTARLRYENPELSLTALALLHTPPISKPGLSHRIKRIESFATEALGRINSIKAPSKDDC